MGDVIQFPVRIITTASRVVPNVRIIQISQENKMQNDLLAFCAVLKALSDKKGS